MVEGLPVAESFRTAGWAGLMAHGTNRARFFVDNVVLRCDLAPP